MGARSMPMAAEECLMGLLNADGSAGSDWWFASTAIP